MEMNEKIRIFREMNKWTQEDMAEKIGMSVTGYAKIERGESSLPYDKLEQMAVVFGRDVADLVNFERKPNWYFSNNSIHTNYANYYPAEGAVVAELEKQYLIVQHLQQLLSEKETLIAQKDELIAQGKKESEALREMIDLLKQSKK